jgi:hypothetical protein
VRLYGGKIMMIFVGKVVMIYGGKIMMLNVGKVVRFYGDKVMRLGEAAPKGLICRPPTLTIRF